MKTEEKLNDSISCVILEKDTNGLSFGKNEEKMGWKNQRRKMNLFYQMTIVGQGDSRL